MKTVSKLEETFLNLVKDNINSPTANISSVKYVAFKIGNK